MATTYSEAPGEVREAAEALIEKRHHDLSDAGVTITYLFAANPDGDAVTHAGYKAAAVMKKTKLADRVAGLADAVLTIDAAWWHDHTERERAALLDHELFHLEVCRDDAGAVKRDDAGRPKLKLRKHDIVIGGFSQVIAWHKEAAVEAQQVHAASEYIQGLFPGWG